MKIEAQKPVSDSCEWHHRTYKLTNIWWKECWYLYSADTNLIFTTPYVEGYLFTNNMGGCKNISKSEFKNFKSFNTLEEAKFYYLMIT